MHETIDFLPTQKEISTMVLSDESVKSMRKKELMPLLGVRSYKTLNKIIEPYKENIGTVRNGVFTCPQVAFLLYCLRKE